MKSVNTVVRLRPLALAICALAALGTSACFFGGDDAGEGALSTAERVQILEAQMDSFQQYIAVQAELQATNEARQVVVEVGEDGEEVLRTTAYIGPPLYSLNRADASENEQEIVLWMADCAARTYLNPELPEEVVDYEISKTQDRMWAALKGGQYSSFEDYIGQSFKFCRAEIVDEGDVE